MFIFMYKGFIVKIKQVLYGALTLVLMVSGQSFGMFHALNRYSACFRGAQLLSAGYCIKKGINEARELNERLKQPVEGELVQGIVKKWARREMGALNITKLPFMYGANDWAITNDKVLKVSR